MGAVQGPVMKPLKDEMSHRGFWNGAPLAERM